MNWYKLFYWLTVADNARSFFVVAIVIFTTIFVLSTITFIVAINEQDMPNTRILARKFMWWAGPIACIFWLAYILTPSKRDSLLIVAGGGALTYLTNDPTASQIPHEMTLFVVTQLKSMSKEAQVELGIQTEKERVIDQAKSMSVSDLLNKLQVDTTFRKLILSQ